MDKNVSLYYADDDRDDLDMFAMAAEELGIEAYLFSSGEAMLAHLKEITEPENVVVFVDLNMPTKTGYEVIEDIKSSDAIHSHPIVILSTAGDHLSVEKSRKAGADYYIQKPTSYRKLKNAISFIANHNWIAEPKPTGFVHNHD